MNTYNLKTIALPIFGNTFKFVLYSRRGKLPAIIMVGKIIEMKFQIVSLNMQPRDMFLPAFFSLNYNPIIEK